MADLGIIRTTDVNRGVRSPDRRAEGQAIGNILEGTAQVVKGAIVKGTEDDILNSIKEDFDNTFSPEEVDSMGPPESRMGSDTEAQRVRDEMNRLVAQRDQGKSAQRTLAEMRINQIVADASNKFPWMREELLRSAGRVTQLSVELDRLGMYDAAMQSAAEQAQSRLDEVQSHATNDWDKGGLGMDPTIPMSDPRWAVQYADRQALRARDTQRQMELSVREMDAGDALEQYGDMYQGKLSAARSSLESLYQKHGLYDVLKAVQGGENANPELIRQFKDVGADMLIKSMGQLRLDVQRVHETFLDPKLKNTEDAAIFTAMRDDFFSQLDKQISLVQDIVNGVPTAAEHFDAMTQIRRINMYKGMSEPSKNFEAFITDPNKKTMFEVGAADMTGSGQVFRFQVAQQANAALMGMNPDLIGPDASVADQVVHAFVTAGQGAITPQMTSSDVIRTLNKHRSDSPTPYNLPAGSVRADQIGAATTIEVHNELWRKARAVDTEASPERAAKFANGLTYAFLGLAQEDVRAPGLDELELENMASNDTFELIQALGDGDYKGSRRALGMAMKDYYVRTDPDKRRNDTIKAYKETRIGGTPLNSLALIDVRKMVDEGQLSYVENKEALNLEVDKRLEVATSLAAIDALDQVPHAKPTRVKIENEVKQEIEQAMEPIIRHVEQDLDIHRNLRLAERPEFEQNEGSLRTRYFNETGWLDGFEFVVRKD